MQELPFPDRRVLKDRRKSQTFPLTRTSLFGARQNIRRVSDQKIHKFVDRYSLRAVLTVLIIVVLSVADAIFTLKLVSVGAQEVNPVMHFFLQYGPLPFLTVKYILTVGSLVCFLVLKNYYFLGGKVRVKVLLGLILAVYLLLIVYELLLLLLV
jgi:hypothetical protein